MLKLSTYPAWDSVRSKMFALFLFIAVSVPSFGQNSYASESQLIEVLGQSKFDQLQQANPNYLKFLDARCTHGYVIMEMPKEKTEGFTMIKKIAKLTGNGTEVIGVTPEQFVLDATSPNFNFLMYKFDFDRSENTYYILGRTGKVLLILPVERINEIVNAGNNE
jgi:hypothetical protein